MGTHPALHAARTCGRTGESGGNKSVVGLRGCAVNAGHGDTPCIASATQKWRNDCVVDKVEKNKSAVGLHCCAVYAGHVGTQHHMGKRRDRPSDIWGGNADHMLHGVEHMLRKKCRAHAARCGAHAAQKVQSTCCTMWSTYNSNS
eukprot:872398-Pelagomonas_calceolata.AAC.3